MAVSRKSVAKQRPFYAGMPGTSSSTSRPSAASIVSEARRSLIRTVNTGRPFTPKERGRTLFATSESSNQRATQLSRPPSAFSGEVGRFESADGRRANAHGKSKSASGTILPPLVPEPGSSQRRPHGAKARHQRPLQAVGTVKRTSSLDDALITTSPQKLDMGQEIAGIPNRRVQSGPARDRVMRDQAVTTANRKSDKGRKLETEESLFERKVLPTLNKVTEKGISLDDATKWSSKLYKVLREEGMLRRGFSKRTTILKELYELLDRNHAPLIVNLLSIVFSMKVSGNNLCSACKVLFLACKNDDNDKLFLTGDIIALLVQTVNEAEPETSMQAMIYLIGAIKLLSGNLRIQEELCAHNFVVVLAKKLAAVNAMLSFAEKSCNEEVSHMLVQLTATLRNMADMQASRAQFLNRCVLLELCTATTHCRQDPDFILNVCRVLSKLTQYADFCQQLASSEVVYSSLTQLLQEYQSNQAVMVRVGFTLGNLTAKNAKSRLSLFKHTSAFNAILKCLQHYIVLDKKEMVGTDKYSKESKAPTQTEDVLIKFVRMIANMSIHPDVGTAIAKHERCLVLLLSILETKSTDVCEELALNVLATINNLSFFTVEGSAVLKQQMSIAELLLQQLMLDHMEGMVEVCRVLGNLSRSPAIRTFLHQHNVDEVLVTLLNSKNRELVYAACGVLINIMADDDKHHILKEQDGVKKLVDVLVDFGYSDWQLSAMVCQTLWNYSQNCKRITRLFGKEQTARLVAILQHFLDEEVMFSDDGTENVAELDEELQRFVKDMWRQEFIPAANLLLNRINSEK